MVGVAAHLSDAVLQPLPIRQWVLSLPKRLRLYLPHDPELVGAILRVLLRALQTHLRRSSSGAAYDTGDGAATSNGPATKPSRRVCSLTGAHPVRYSCPWASSCWGADAWALTNPMSSRAWR